MNFNAIITRPFLITITRSIIVVAIGIAFTFSPACGQKIDSLKSLLQTSTGIKQADILFELSLAHIDVDNPLSFRYALKSFSIAKKMNDSLRVLKSGRMLASSLRRVDKVDSSITIYVQILPIAEKKGDKDALKVILNSLGLSYTFKGDYDKALLQHFRAMALCEQTGDSLRLSMNLNNVGLVYYKLEDHNKALVYFKRCLEVKKKTRSTYDLDRLLLNISSSYAYKNSFTEARNYVDQALASCGNNCSDYIIVMANYNLGFTSYRAGELPEAETYLKKSYSLAKRINDGRYQLDNVDLLSRLYIQKNQLAKAIEYLNEAEKLIKNNRLPYSREKLNIYARFFEIYGKMSDLKKTAWYQQKYIQLKDSIYDDELTTNLMKIEADYLERENKTRIASQEQVLVLKEAVIERQQWLNIFIGSTAVMLVLLVAVLVRSNRQKRRNNQMLEESVRERTKELQENNKALLTTQNDNDMFVAKASREIRGVVASIKGVCAAGLHDIAAPEARQYLDEVNAMSDQLVLEIQRLQDAVSLV